MKMKLLGFRTMDFKADDGKEIKGTKLFVSYKDSEVEGRCCTPIFISSKATDVIAIDLKLFIEKEIEVEMGIKGKVLAISG